MFALVARFDLADIESAAKFDALAGEIVAAVAEHEPGTLLYAVHRVAGEPLARVFYETYADRSAFEDHENHLHTRHFLSERAKYVTSARVEFLEPAMTKGMPS